MDRFTTIIPVDVSKGLARVNIGDVLATQDNGANRIGARLVGASGSVSTSGTTITGYFVRPDGTTVLLTGAADGNVVYVDLNKNCYKYDGAFTLAVKVSTSKMVMTVLVVDGRIIQSQTGAVVDPESVVPTIDELLAMISDMNSASSRAIAAAGAANGAAANATNAANAANQKAGTAETAASNAASAATRADQKAQLASEKAQQAQTAAQRANAAAQVVESGGYVQKQDIVNDLTQNSTDKPLSAAQGKELKRQIDGKANNGAVIKSVNGVFTPDANGNVQIPLQGISESKFTKTAITVSAQLVSGSHTGTRVNNEGITPGMVVASCAINPSTAQGSDWVINTYNGYLTIGTQSISAAVAENCTLQIVLVETGKTYYEL